MSPVGHEPAALRSRVMHSTTEPLGSRNIVTQLSPHLELIGDDGSEIIPKCSHLIDTKGPGVWFCR